TVNGAKRGFTLPGFSFQPSEFTKMATILYLAAIISRHKEKYKVSTTKTDIILLVKMGVVTGIPLLFILQQPDLGTSIVFIFITGVLVLLSGVDWKLIAAIVVGATVIVAAGIGLILKFPDAASAVGIKPYQAERVVTWFDP